MRRPDVFRPRIRAIARDEERKDARQRVLGGVHSGNELTIRRLYSASHGGGDLNPHCTCIEFEGRKRELAHSNDPPRSIVNLAIPPHRGPHADVSKAHGRFFCHPTHALSLRHHAVRVIPRLRPVREGGGCTAAAVCLYSRELLLYSGAVIPRLCPVCEGEPWGGDNTVGTVFPNSKKVNIK